MKKVTAALLMKENKILIEQRKSTDKLAGKWEFPGGKQEDGETLEECLRREMNEEFGIGSECWRVLWRKYLSL
ncbi:NUDIX domain-containing protein [Paenibacillus plantarum]|uniref:NUDIX domain-containing protein n=1 Tax=Paenibacillus plantarum TaxID=2654975 RepID=UPI001FE9ED87|nr:NUDIX domain-containing protein [Paenibacillus plantarum]